MTRQQYISNLTDSGKSTRGKDVPQECCASVIDGLCEVISDKDSIIADKDSIIADRDSIIADKDVIIADKDIIISEREKQIAEMQQQLIWYKRKVFGSMSEKHHPQEPYDPNYPSFYEDEFGVVEVPTDDEIKETEEKVKDTISDVHSEAEKRRKEKNEHKSRKGWTYSIPASIPRMEPNIHYPEGYSKETMQIIGWSKRETLEMKEAQFSVRVDMNAICKPIDSKPTDAHTEIIEAKAAQNCLPGCIAGNSTMAAIVTDKFCHHIPEYRQAKRFESFGIKIPTSSINRWVHALANKLCPIYELQMELIFSSKYQHIDESTIPVNDQKHKTRKGYIWSDVDGLGKYGLAFFYEKGSRGGKVIRPKILKRNIAMQTDGYSVYQSIEKDKLDGITTLYCMAHARRKFENIQNTSPEARKILSYIRVLYELEANLKHNKATHDEIKRERQEKAVPILKLIKLLLDKFVTVATPSDALTTACHYSIDRWDGLCRYCEEGYYDIDNNAVERSIRPLTLGRKNWLFVDSDDSAKDTAIYLTLIGSCNLLGITPYEYFMTILPRLKPTMTDEDYKQLLPYKIAEEIKEKEK